MMQRLKDWWNNDPSIGRYPAEQSGTNGEAVLFLIYILGGYFLLKFLILGYV